jgi:hypothetical protein
MNVLFLDIDGVVNCATTTQRHRGVIGIDPYMALIVGNIVDKTNVKVVLSSTWRLWKHTKEEVEAQVVKLYDVTPHLGGLDRGYEIKEWLDQHPDVERYAILDDNSDMLPEQMDHFFQTTWKDGINQTIADKIISYFLD